MKTFYSKGFAVLCYDKDMVMVREIPYQTEQQALARADAIRKTGRYQHVEAVEKVEIK